MTRRDLLEDSESESRWLVSYSDFMTLLFAFFVVMYAISSVNEGKYQSLKESLELAFDGVPRSMDPIQIGEVLHSASPHIIDIADSAGFVDPERGNTELRLDRKMIESQLAGYVDDYGIQVRENQDWFEITLEATLMFAPGSARLEDEAKIVLTEVVNFLRRFHNPITVEGFTDNVPSESSRFPSNWELSSARASSVASFLTRGGIDRKRLSAVGYGENHPLKTNATPAGRAVNRRVGIVVARRSDIARNLNAPATISAFAFARSEATPILGDDVVRKRTATGGVLFTDRKPDDP